MSPPRLQIGWSLETSSEGQQPASQRIKVEELEIKPVLSRENESQDLVVCTPPRPSVPSLRTATPSSQRKSKTIESSTFVGGSTLTPVVRRAINPYRRPTTTSPQRTPTPATSSKRTKTRKPPAVDSDDEPVELFGLSPLFSSASQSPSPVRTNVCSTKGNHLVPYRARSSSMVSTTHPIRPMSFREGSTFSQMSAATWVDVSQERRPKNLNPPRNREPRDRTGPAPTMLSPSMPINISSYLAVITKIVNEFDSQKENITGKEVADTLISAFFCLGLEGMSDMVQAIVKGLESEEVLVPQHSIPQILSAISSMLRLSLHGALGGYPCSIRGKPAAEVRVGTWWMETKPKLAAVVEASGLDCDLTNMLEVMDQAEQYWRDRAEVLVVTLRQRVPVISARKVRHLATAFKGLCDDLLAAVIKRSSL